MNVQVSFKDPDFVGKTLGHLLERSRAMGLQIVIGPSGDVAWYFDQIVRDGKIRESWGFVATSLNELIGIKRKEVLQLKSDVENGRYADLEDARSMLVQALQLEEEMRNLETHLEAMANV